ncbi:chondroitin proteoglycan-2-like, partial [Leptodactylus fuscus]|uniref:chondroitin proteoglycan-2-like n=1 Tax=Leptodactylus fuscus TaxID=238119 RepID=UPI003F4F30FD
SPKTSPSGSSPKTGHPEGIPSHNAPKTNPNGSIPKTSHHESIPSHSNPKTSPSGTSPESNHPETIPSHSSHKISGVPSHNIPESIPSGSSHPHTLPKGNTPTLPPAKTHKEFCAGRASGLYPVAGDKNAFWHCSDGITYKQFCPAGLVFDVTCECCNYPPAPPAKTQKEFCTGRASGLYPVAGDKNAFWNCANGRTYKQYCQTGLVFEESCQCCNYPPPTVKEFCAGRASGLYPVAGDKNAFWNCANGITYKQYCSAGLVFDTSCECCNYPTASD